MLWVWQKITNLKQLTSNIHCMSSFVSSLIVTIDSSVLGVNCQVPQAKMSVVLNVKASNNNQVILFSVASKLLLCATKGNT